MVSVMPPAPVPPVVGALLPVSPALVLAAASVVGAALVAAAAVVSLLLLLLLPQAAATNAVPANSATTWALLRVLLTYLTSWFVWFGRVRPATARRPGALSLCCLPLSGGDAAGTARNQTGVRPQHVHS